MDVKISTLLNATQRVEGFVYEHTRLVRMFGGFQIKVDLREHKQCSAKCSQCQCDAPGYDHLAKREWIGIPILGIAVLLYAPRRVTRLRVPSLGLIWNVPDDTAYDVNFTPPQGGDVTQA